MSNEFSTAAHWPGGFNEAGLIWLVLLPFRLVGIVVGGTFDFIAALFRLPGRMLRAI